MEGGGREKEGERAGGGGEGRREGGGEGEGKGEGGRRVYLHHQERKRCPRCLEWGAETEQQSPPQLPSADETLPSLCLSLLQKTC